jgi:DNA helicase-2/ATP-dependent DNA helicase PcrA
MKKTQDHSAFNEALNNLNKAQRSAVEAIDGPVMVVAGPGTGKTQILTLRIANILVQTDTKPEQILALTFTESGAKAMRERLRKYIGATAYQVPIYTFHGFAQKLISDYPDSYNRVIGGRPVSDLEKINIIEDILNGGEVKLLRPMGDTSYYVTHILRIISKLKQEYITPEEFSKLILNQENELENIAKIHEKGAHKGKVRGEYTKSEKSLNKNKELLFVYQRYEAMLTNNKFYDFEDMIVETVKAMSANEEMLRDLQENYQYILADEHQDVNGAQNKILELLASFHDSPNIFAVGDEKQAIYRFQGASLENFLYFTEHFAGTEVISLVDNYRSGQVILDVAHSLVEVESGPLKKLRIPLTAVEPKDSVIERRDFSHQAVEDNWLIESVVSSIKNGVPESEIAIIVRTNREVEQVAVQLRKAGLSVTASADGDVLVHPITQAVLGLIDVVITNISEKALFKVLHGAYFGIEANDLLKIFSAQSYQRKLWQILSSEEILKEIGVSNISAVSKVVSVISEARNLEVHEAPHRVLEYILKESGFLNHVTTYDAFEGARVVRRLYDEIEAMVSRDGVSSLREVSNAFSTRLAYGLPLNAPYIETDKNSVQVMTAHKSKGLEFEVVFIPHLNDTAWSGANKKKYFEIPLAAQSLDLEHEYIEDERRLLYVAITRAKSKLYISTAGTSSSGRELIPARLLEDIDVDLITQCDVSKEDDNFNPLKIVEPHNSAIAINSELLHKLLSERGFSATSLNNYLRSPWDYFYRNVLRIPETQALSMQFGTAVHSVLEFVTRYHTKEGKMPSDTQIRNKLEIALSLLPVGTEDFTRLFEKGLEALLVYIPQLENKIPKTTKEEFKLRVHLPTGIPELPELILTGNIDRIDIGDDGLALRVVDYKTGKPKSRNVIEGKTKDADGAYKLQLVFYALLLSLHDDERYMCKEGVLSFVEPTAKGEVKEESFLITDAEIEELKKVIIQATKEIISGDFLNMPCDPKVSDYCDLASQLRR